MCDVIIPFFSEEPTVTGDNFLVMENTALCHHPVRIDFQLDGATSHFSCCDRDFLDRELPHH